MRILIVSHTFPLHPQDGTAHFMLDFAQGFVSLGHSVTVLLPYHPGLKPKSFKKIAVKSFRYIFPDLLSLLGYGRTLINNQRIRWFVPFLTPWLVLFEFITLLHETRSGRYDIISAHWVLPNGLVAALVSRITHIPLVISLPGTDVYIARLNGMFRAVANFAVRQAHSVVSNSPLLLRDLDVRGAVIPYGAPLQHNKRTRHRGITVAAAGREARNKNFGMLLDADPSAVILRGLTIHDFRRTLLGVDILVAPSIRDIRGNLDDANVVAIEAMSAGCAVIASDLPGYRGFIHSGIHGILVPPNNTKALVKALTKLKNNTSLRKRLGTHARSRVRQSLTPSRIASRYLTLFRRAIAT